MGKSRDEELLPKVSEALLDGSCGREDTFYNKSASIAGSVPGCNITTVRHEKNRRTDWSGLGRTPELKPDYR